MSQEQHAVALAPPPAVWPPDDTEESVLGTNLHQATITNLRLGLNEVASLLVAQGRPAFRQALSQTAISGLRRWDGSSYTVLPDVFVYRQAIDERRATLILAEDGPPLLIAEVLSPTTQLRDLNLERGKGYSYARAGVREYLILDPGGAELAEQGQGWRLEEGIYVPWRPDATGRWQSRVIPVAVGFEGVRLVVFGGDGRRQLREGEVARTVSQMEGTLARQAEALAEKDAEIARRNEEIAALRRALDQRRGE
jgi:Putative restriction endonuclease